MYPSLEIARDMLALFGCRPHMTHAPRPYTHLSRDDLATYVEWESAHRARSARPRPVQAPLALSGQTSGDPDTPEPSAAGSGGPGDTPLPVPRRRTPPRLRVAFLHHYRAYGEVKLAAERIGVSLSTLYRWCERDAAFRRRWESLAEQRRQMAEDRLMSVVRNGEKTSVFYKGRMVGWRQSFTARAALAALAYFERREKAQARTPEKARPAPSGVADEADVVDEAVVVDEVGDRPPRQTCTEPGAIGKRAGRGRPGKAAQPVGRPAQMEACPPDHWSGNDRVGGDAALTRPAAVSGHMFEISGERRDADAGGNQHQGESAGLDKPEDPRQTSARHARDAGPAAVAAIGCERYVAGDRAMWPGPAHRVDDARVDQRMIVVARPPEVGAVLPPPSAGDDP